MDAKEIQDKLCKEYTGIKTLSANQITEIEFTFNSKGFCRFKNRNEGCKNRATLEDYTSCGWRCNIQYWRDHGKRVGTLMSSLANLLKESETLYYQTGLLHDIDYLNFPHDSNFDENQKHPIPIVEKLQKLDAHRDMILAILEHAPSTRVNSTSIISHALRVCDVMVTSYEVTPNGLPIPEKYTKLKLLNKFCEKKIFNNTTFMKDKTTLTPNRISSFLENSFIELNSKLNTLI